MVEDTHKDEALRLQDFLNDGLNRLPEVSEVHAGQIERFLEITAQALIGHISLIDE